jgi:hypothetical protein
MTDRERLQGLAEGKLSKVNAVNLRRQFKDASGIAITGCMCSTAERRKLAATVTQWLVDNEPIEDND